MLSTIAKGVLGIAIATAGIGVIAGPALADGAFNATVAGQRSYTPLVNLATSSTQTVDAVNLPANVGLYVMHCQVPADPRTPPTACDASTGSLAYLPAAADARAAVSIPVKVNGEFFGTNPNPMAASTAPVSVDCRAKTADPHSTACALYVMGAGRESANPAYLKVFPTSFLPVSAQRKTDAAIVTLNGKTVSKGAKPALHKGVATTFSVALTSGLTPTVTADNCSIAAGSITALNDKGTCLVRITSTGGKNVKPLVATQVFTLKK